MTKTKTCARVSFAVSLAVALVFSIGAAANGQTSQSTPMPSNPPTANPGPPTGQPVGPAPRQPMPPSNNITQWDIDEMAQFLDHHPEVAEQLEKDPSLIDNQRWVSEHPALQNFLRDHPRLDAAFRANPNQFMHDEESYIRQQDDITRRDVAMMNEFLDKHPEIAEQLRKDPSLIDNRRWVADHPALQEYLRDHPQIADAFRANPDQFMRDEERYGRNGDHFRGNGPDSERYQGELKGFGQFLGSHSSVAAELSANPSLANDKEYQATHAELNEYLQAHPAMSQQLAENPQAVMGSSWVQESGGFSAKPVTPKPKTGPNQ